MPNRNYQRGRAFEYRVKKELENDGFHVVRKFASKGCYDLLAIKKNKVLLVQCKYCTGRLSKKEKQDLLEIVEITGAIPVVATAMKGKPILYADTRYVKGNPFSGLWIGPTRRPVPIFEDDRQSLLIEDKVLS